MNSLVSSENDQVTSLYNGFYYRDVRMDHLFSKTQLKSHFGPTLGGICRAQSMKNHILYKMSLLKVRVRIIHWYTQIQGILGQMLGCVLYLGSYYTRKITDLFYIYMLYIKQLCQQYIQCIKLLMKFYMLIFAHHFCLQVIYSMKYVIYLALSYL